MWDADPRRRRRGRRSDELKTEHLLGIEAPLCELRAPPFRFLRLPAEIRNRIYSYHFEATQQEPHYNLIKVKDPPITLVCKQTRREAQPIFFGECSFMFDVRANYLELSRKHEAGLLCLTPRVRRCLLSAGDAAVFRNLHIRLLGLSFVPSARLRADPPRYMHYNQLASVSIKTHPTLEYVTTRGLGCPHTGTSPALDSYVEQIDKALSTAQDVAEKLRVREEFKGYTLDDLTWIAKAFCVDA
ncbi:hypothetical protein Slin15195_G065440 [Septoria linicola]|uniref:Uncharacterized protein n=1 Tax=Septoria linicola TaxID=215465 RepID=A0A9Q9AQH1_9PEZI|nr:hypothetical protein Slin14017_G115780 [Septoria linicola]USW53225.1 hypothetical protein Slin15195_G065440 [Septoria linicola]